MSDWGIVIKQICFKKNFIQNEKGETLTSTIIALGLFGLLVVFVLNFTMGANKNQLENNISDEILSQTRKIQQDLGALNSACMNNFKGLSFNSSDVSLPAINQLYVDAGHTIVLLDTAQPIKYNIKINSMQVIDIKKISDTKFFGNFTLQFEKPAGSFNKDIQKKIPIYLSVSGGPTAFQIQDCSSGADVSESEKMALCLASERVDSFTGISYPSTWDPINKKCIYQTTVNGVCGSESKSLPQYVTTTPVSSGLCSSGFPSAIIDTVGTGPYDWTCNGAFGGTSQNCHASFCKVNHSGQMNQTTRYIRWQDKPGHNTGAWAFCRNGATYNAPGSCSGTLMSSTQCDVPHSQNDDGHLQNGAYIRCCIL